MSKLKVTVLDNRIKLTKSSNCVCISEKKPYTNIQTQQLVLKIKDVVIVNDSSICDVAVNKLDW